MKIVSKDEMELIDKESSTLFGIPSTILMENAGISIAKKILNIYPNINPITILVGPGNNGGDGLVIGRWFFARNFNVQLYSLAAKEKFKKDALLNLSIAEKLKIPIHFTTNTQEWNKYNILKYPFLIDAIFGTGLTNEPRNFYKKCIQNINQNYKGKLIAVDNPSGLINIKDKKTTLMLKASHTITVGLPKISMIDYPAKQYIGKLHIVNIGFPKTLLNHNRIKTNLITKQLVQNILPQRPKNSHKGTFGQLLVIGGSKTYKGAPILSAIAGLKSGCGLVSLASIPTVCNAFTNQFPEGISIELKENNNGSINFNNKNLITTLINKYNTIIFGPGISTDPDCLKILKHILENYNGTTIIDADGLNLLANNINLLNKTNTKTILTPHIKEMARLLKQNNSPIKNKLQTLENFAKNYNTTVILKSAVTTIFTPDGSSFFNTTGNHGMASAGSGDVLAGIIGSFVAQGLNTTNSSILATYLHGLAGDIAQNYENPFSITASSIIKYIHKAFSNLEENLHHHQHKLH